MVPHSCVLAHAALLRFLALLLQFLLQRCTPKCWEFLRTWSWALSLLLFIHPLPDLTHFKYHINVCIKSEHQICSQLSVIWNSSSQTWTVCSSTISIKGTATNHWFWLETHNSFDIFLLTPPSKFTSNPFSSPHHHPNPNHHHLFFNYSGLHIWPCFHSCLSSPIPFPQSGQLLILECTSNHGTPLLKPFWELLFVLRIKFTWPTKTSVMWPTYISLCTSVLFPLFQSYPQTKIFVDYFQPLHTAIPLAWNRLLILLLITIHPNTISQRRTHSASI